MNVWIHPVIAERANIESDNSVDASGSLKLGECLKRVGGEKLFHLVVDETGTLRPHINIFLNEEVSEKDLAAEISPGTRIDVFTAVSGG